MVCDCAVRAASRTAMEKNRPSRWRNGRNGEDKDPRAKSIPERILRDLPGEGEITAAVMPQRFSGLERQFEREKEGRFGFHECAHDGRQNTLLVRGLRVVHSQTRSLCSAVLYVAGCP